MCSNLLDEIPEHGEHEVDFLLHRIFQNKKNIYDIYSNPPGATWSKLKIVHPYTKDEYIWPNIERDPGDKFVKPDSIIQFIEGKKIQLLTIESKEKESAAKLDMAAKMEQFFARKLDPIGMYNKPTLFVHRKNQTEVKEVPKREQDWFKKWKEKQIFTGFAFCYPEKFSDCGNIKLSKELSFAGNMKNFDVLFGFGWCGKDQEPFVVLRLTAKFEKTAFGKRIQEIVKNSCKTIL